MSRTAAGLLLLIIVTLGATPSAFAGSSSLMDISADGMLLACSNRDSGTVTIVDLKSQKKLREMPVGHKPEGVAFLGKSHKIAVASFADDVVVFFDADAGKELGRTDVFDEPYGVVSDAAGKRVFVTLSYPGQVVEIDVTTFKQTRAMDAGRSVRGLAISNDDARLYVTEYYTANVISLDTATGKVADRWDGISSDNLSRQVVLHPTRDKAYIPHIRSATERAHGEGSIFPYVTVLDTHAATKPEEKRRKRIDGQLCQHPRDRQPVGDGDHTRWEEVLRRVRRHV